MAIKIAGTSVISDVAKLQNFNTISGKYSSFYPNSETITTVVDMNKPIMTVELTAATTFTASNVATGKTAILLLDVGAGGNTPTFPSSFKFAEDTEPSWSGTRYWQIGLTAWDNSTVRVIATGWEGPNAGGGGGGATVDLGLARWYIVSVENGDDGTGTAHASMTFNTDGTVTFSSTGSVGGAGGYAVSTTGGGNSPSWGSNVTGSNYDVKYTFTQTQESGTRSLVTNPGNGVWLNLGTARTWKVTGGTNAPANDGNIKLDGVIQIRDASTQSVLDTENYDISALNYGIGIGNICLTNDMLVQVEGRGLVRVYDLEVGDFVFSPSGWTRIENIVKDHPREGFYLVDDWLEITNDHPMLINNEWTLPGDYQGNKTYHPENVNTVYVETQSGEFIVFNEDGDNITVSGDYAKGKEI